MLVTSKGVIYFSYETPIAAVFEAENKGIVIVSQNQWSRTTARHLNMVDADESRRVPHEVLLAMIKEVFGFDNEPKSAD